jgi:hypothetical protein
MSSVILLLAGVLIGAGALYFYKMQTGKITVKQNAVVLLEQVKKVCKLITVEGDFSEIFHHTEKQPVFFNLWSTEKKAMIIVKAKAQVGYDLSKMEFELNEPNRKITLLSLPKPEILSLQTDYQYYDVSDGTFNKFDAEDFTKLQIDAKKFIEERVMDSNLPKLADNQAGEVFQLLRNTTQSMGWKFEINNFKSTAELMKKEPVALLR